LQKHSETHVEKKLKKIKTESEDSSYEGESNLKKIKTEVFEDCNSYDYEGDCNDLLRQNTAVKHIKSLSCRLCKFETKGEIALKQHHYNTHPREAFLEQTIACGHCPFKSVLLEKLEQHKCTHSGEKIFGCEQCPYRATQQFILDNHIILRHPNIDMGVEKSYKFLSAFYS